MALDTYTALQTAVLSWLARPGDPLVAPAVPDMVCLFEAEARRRLKVRETEKQASLITQPGNPGVALPGDFGQLRHAVSDNYLLAYVPPDLLMRGNGPPRTYTIHGNQMRLGPTPDTSYTVNILYQSGLPPLSNSNPTNWLLTAHADAYLYGSLMEAEAYIGHDERIQLWAQRREAAFSSIEQADRKARWPGGLQIRVDGITATGGAGGDWGLGGTVVTASRVVRAVNPGDGSTVTMLDSDRYLYIAGGPRAALTIRLPVTTAIVPGEDEVEISFENPVTVLTIADSAGGAVGEAPHSAYGPGAGQVFRYLLAEGGWLYWK